MKNYATLLIQHLEMIYPMVERGIVIKHGFLAFYHDEIIGVGVGDGLTFIDKDTRIMEGRGHIAVPAFCDVSMCLPTSAHYTKKMNTLANQIQACFENTTIFMRHGTLIGNQRRKFHEQEQQIVDCFQPTYLFDFKNQPGIDVPIVLPFDSTPIDASQPFCISCGYPTYVCLDQLLCGKMFYQIHDVDAYDVLAACTRYPTDALQLHRYGRIEVGCVGNVILLEGDCIEQVWMRLCGDEYIQVIKEGVCIYPNVLI